MRTIVYVFFALLVSSCSSFTEGKSIAESAVKNFHSAYNSIQFTQIYDNTDPDFKNATSKDKFLIFIEAVFKKLGPVNRTENASWNVKSYNLATYVSLTQETEFKDGLATETFVYRIKDKKAMLVQYNIISDILIIK